MAESGSYHLVLTSGLEELGERFVLDVVRLGHGERTWEYGLETGTLVVTNASEWDGQGVPAAVHFWEGEGDVDVLTVLAGDCDRCAARRRAPGEGPYRAPRR